jgi:hypothetical protein
MKKLDAKTAHRHAGLCATFMWQDETAEGRLDGYAEVDHTSIIGTLPADKNGSPVFIVHVDGTATSTFGYSYEVEMDVKVEMKENGEPLVSEATEQEIKEAEQHNITLACKEYTNLMQLIHAGAYSERDHEGNYAPDGVEKRIDELDEWAIAQGLHFIRQGDEYTLEQATQEEIDAYEQALEDEDEEE